MKYLSSIIAVAALILCMSASASTTLTYEFSFTGADLMGYSYANGADGSSAADNGLFDGARLQRRDSGRTYVQSEHSAFDSWVAGNTDGVDDDRYLSFNLWGFDGRGINWGEDFKHYQWINTTEPAGWTSWTSAWPWGDPPAGSHTDLLLGWDADSFADGLNFNDTDLADKEFKFQVKFLEDDMFWGQDTQGAPNELPELTFWFGGWFNDDYDVWTAQNDDYYIYEGNMTLEGTLVATPEPMTMAGAAMLGLGGLFARRFRRKR